MEAVPPQYLTNNGTHLFHLSNMDAMAAQTQIMLMIATADGWFMISGKKTTTMKIPPNSKPKTINSQTLKCCFSLFFVPTPLLDVVLFFFLIFFISCNFFEV